MKTPIKMIVTDLDGTLLRSDKTVSDRTKATLARCREQGIKLAYATGRCASALKLAPSELFDGYATANGAIAMVDNTLIYKRLIPYQDARPLLLACDRRGLDISSQLGGMDYSNFVMSDVWPEVTNFTLVDFASHETDAEKIISHNLTVEDMDFIESHLPRYAYMVMAIDGLAMITHKEATKSKAIAALAGYWGITQSEILAFGDDLNDIDLLEYAGVGVVMDNARDVVKRVGDYICPSNDEDGIAAWIENNILT